MRLAVTCRDKMKAAAVSAIPKAQDLFSMEEALNSYLYLLRNTK